MMCEKCWGDAFTKAHHTGFCQVSWYEHIVKNCQHTPKEKAGQWWNEEKQTADFSIEKDVE